VKLPIIAMAVGLSLAGVAGFATSQAQTGSPTRTVTINVATGPRGPAGPAGPPGPAGPRGPKGDPGTGGSNCPSGFTPGEVVINHPSGQATIYTCLKG